MFGKSLMNYVQGKGMVGQYPFGFPVLLGIFGKFFRGHIEYFVPLMGAIGVVLFYLLNKTYFNREQALYASLLLAVMPGYFYWSTLLFADIPSVVFFILGLYLLETFFRTKKVMWFIIGSFILAFNICIKYTNVIIFPALLIYLYLRRNEFSNIKRDLLLGCLSCIIPILLLLAYHQCIYDNPFVTGYHAFGEKLRLMSCSHSMYSEEATKTSSFVMSTGVKPFFKHILGFPIQAAVFLPYVLFGLVTTLFLLKTHKHLFYLILTTFLLIVLFHAGIGGTHGSQLKEMTMHSSYLRYLLLVFVLLIIPVAFFISSLSYTKSVKIGIVLILILSSIFNNLSGVPTSTLRSYYSKKVPRAQNTINILLSNIPEKGVVFSNIQARYNLPNVATVLIGYVSLESLISIIKMLLNDDIKVYVIVEGKGKMKANFVLNATDNKSINKKMKLYQIIRMHEEEQKV
jgi:4-amino-4-deoxy-L-arabinose transferase-like glycosyltransferase